MATAIPILLASFAAVLLIAAAINDIAARTIPNWISLAIAADGLTLRLLTSNAFRGTAVAVLALVVTIVLWLRGYIGGGDAKLIPASVLLVPPALAPSLILAIAITGGVLAALYLVLYRTVRPPLPGMRKGFPARLLKAEAWRISRRAGLPYAVAIAGGSLPVLFLAHGW